MQAMEKWGYVDKIGPGVANGQSEIKFTQLEFTRPADIANQYEPNEGFTGLIQVRRPCHTSCHMVPFMYCI